MGYLSVFVLDTCTLLWWTLEPDKLSRDAEDACAAIDRQGAFISSITIWEIGIKLKKGVLDIGENIASYVNRLKLLQSVEIIPVDENIWVKNLELDWAHKDPADRTIVATAILENLPIVTKDQIIRGFYSNTIW